MKRTRVILASVATVAALALTACGGGGDDNPLSSGGSSAAPTDTIVVGSANFPESTLLAQIYAGALTAKGVKVSTKLNIGSRETYIPGLQDGSIDLIPEYSGVLLQYFDKNATQVTSDDVFAALELTDPLTGAPITAATEICSGSTRMCWMRTSRGIVASAVTRLPRVRMTLIWDDFLSVAKFDSR